MPKQLWQFLWSLAVFSVIAAATDAGWTALVLSVLWLFISDAKRVELESRLADAERDAGRAEASRRSELETLAQRIKFLEDNAQIRRRQFDVN